MMKKLFLLIVLAALAYGTYLVVQYFSEPISNIKKQGGDQSVPDDETSRLRFPDPDGRTNGAVYFV